MSLKATTSNTNTNTCGSTAIPSPVGNQSPATPSQLHLTRAMSMASSGSVAGVSLGEEGEVTVCAVRAKLFSLSPENGWTDMGVGPVKVNLDPQTRTARIGKFGTCTSFRSIGQ